ncbi:MAG: VOC family protein [Candidatus Babeliales bacterium]
MQLFNHVQIKVENLKRSQDFYNAIMDILGYSVVLEIENNVIGYGTSVHDMFEIRRATKEAPLSKSVHVAFNASTLQKVNDFYKTALEKGATCNGKPDYRPEYEEGYYAAFVIDPDGHNIEAVYMKE